MSECATNPVGWPPPGDSTGGRLNQRKTKNQKAKGKRRRASVRACVRPSVRLCVCLSSSSCPSPLLLPLSPAPLSPSLLLLLLLHHLLLLRLLRLHLRNPATAAATASNNRWHITWFSDVDWVAVPQAPPPPPPEPRPLFLAVVSLSLSLCSFQRPFYGGCPNNRRTFSLFVCLFVCLFYSLSLSLSISLSPNHYRSARKAETERQQNQTRKRIPNKPNPTNRYKKYINPSADGPSPAPFLLSRIALIGCDEIELVGFFFFFFFFFL